MTDVIDITNPKIIDIKTGKPRKQFQVNINIKAGQPVVPIALNFNVIRNPTTGALEITTGD